MNEFKETSSLEKKVHIDEPIVREEDTLRLPSDIKKKYTYFSDLDDVFTAAFRRFGLTVDGTKNKHDTNDSSDDKNHSYYLEKGDNGKYYDKETGKVYNSVEEWERKQKILAQKYDSTAKYYHNKAKKEWAKYKNAEKNGESEEEKREHYRRSQEYYAKAKECKEKAEKIRRKLSRVSETNVNSKDVKRNNDKEIADVNQPIKNKTDGLAREKEVAEELEKKYPKEEGYEIISEAYLRDKDGNIVRDPETGEARRIDFVVVKDGKVVDSVEVTSKTADKTAQNAKEKRIRDAGGNYIRDNNGNLVEIPSSVQTRIERRK